MTSYTEAYKKAVKAKTARQLTPRYHKFTRENETLVGKYIAKYQIASSLSEGNYNHYLIETDEGLVKFHMGRATDNEIADVLVKGVVYAFTFLESIPLDKGRSVNRFNVEEINVSEPIEETEAENE